VLVEGDDLSEPISDAMRGILDGHLWLSRELANRGHYPAIDVLESISRVMPDVTSVEHQQRAREVIRLAALYQDVQDLVNIGAYAAGTNDEIDRAVKAQPEIRRFLQQGVDEKVSFEQAGEELKRLVASFRGGPTEGRLPRQDAGDKLPPAAPPDAGSLERMRIGV